MGGETTIISTAITEHFKKCKSHFLFLLNTDQLFAKFNSLIFRSCSVSYILEKIPFSPHTEFDPECTIIIKMKAVSGNRIGIVRLFEIPQFSNTRIKGRELFQ